MRRSPHRGNSGPNSASRRQTSSEASINEKGEIVVEGRVIELLPGSWFNIELISEGFEGHVVRAKISGKMRMNYIKIVPGDRVQIVIPQEDENMETGRITYRYK